MNVDALGFWFLKNEMNRRLVNRFGAGNLRHRYLDTGKPIGGDVEILSRIPTRPLVFANQRSGLREHKPSESSTTFRLRNARLNTASGYIFDAGGALMADFSSWPISSLRTDRLATPGRVRRHFTGADYLFLGTQGYYHWLIEDLPAYLHARAASRDAVTLIRPRSPRFVTDVLELLGARYMEAPVVAHVQYLVFASKGVALVPNTPNVESLRDFQHSLNSPLSDRNPFSSPPLPGTTSSPGMTRSKASLSGRRIYVSRRDSNRFPDNESAVEDCVREFGFEIVNLTTLSFLEQIALFAGAQTVVGTHGAGLANIIWCSPHTTHFIEILRNNNPRCFEELASAADLIYASVLAPTDGPWQVDISSLERALAATA